jgi:hypothetical protein
MMSTKRAAWRARLRSLLAGALTIHVAASVALAGKETVQSVRIETARSHFERGEAIAFEISNHSPDTIYFVHGCSTPLVERLEGGRALPLATSKTESVPEPTALAPGQTLRCSWSQQIWQDASLPGRERFSSYTELALVPEGRYRLHLEYAASRSDAEENLRLQSIHGATLGIGE